MSTNLTEKLDSLLEGINSAWGVLKIDTKKAEVLVLKRAMESPDFWNNQEKAREVSQKVSNLQKEISKWEKIKKEVSDLAELARNNENDIELKKQIEEELQKKEEKFAQLEFHLLFNDKYDYNSAILSIHAGTGGTDAQDWAAMLLRMYARFAEKKGWQIAIVDQTVGEEAGIKSATIRIDGEYAFGNLKSETGVHRLVRISPFDAEAMRHTSFALVEILPELAEADKVKINEEDLRIDVFRAGGHGGQGVNTTDSAVRITHLPSGISVKCENERSQLQNKETALKILAAKLLAREVEKEKQEKREILGDLKKAEWGAQIRSYVLHPYKMVKDHRTNYEVNDAEKVLDGEIDGFVEEYLKKNAK